MFIDCIFFVASKVEPFTAFLVYLSFFNELFIHIPFPFVVHLLLLIYQDLCNKDINSLTKGGREKSINYSGAINRNKFCCYFSVHTLDTSDTRCVSFLHQAVLIPTWS